MSFPLIIVGAGASYDFMDKSKFPESKVFQNKLDQYQPPLTNSLFNTENFLDIIDEYQPHISALASYINNKIAGGKYSFEDCLTDIKNNKIKSNPDLYNQLVSLKFYLAELMFQVSENYFKSVNNYVDLIQQIKNNGGNACFVSYNYDLLLEKSLNFDKLENTNRYIGNPIDLIKIHGSCNWFYRRRVNSWGESKSCYDLALAAAQNIVENEDYGKEIVILNSKKCKNMYSEEYDPMSCITYLPALALPINNKDNYVCPESHIDSLKNRIDFADRIIIIGWRAADSFLIDLLNDKIKNKLIPIAIVCGKN